MADIHIFGAWKLPGPAISSILAISRFPRFDICLEGSRVKTAAARELALVRELTRRYLN